MSSTKNLKENWACFENIKEQFALRDGEDTQKGLSIPFAFHVASCYLSFTTCS